ncbi:BQ5605_C003g02122 [Microbotryum silenes-dioicae]|uniref:BQ5605_C003g02122 protein n=1 Tax=Microbotryum silenes-dioicae TaxID=796604 RepID=A0A2X0M522_9BASI|nr:BQ5605_C003g02122 [Microbotryum silenes-dioicae]
MKFKSHENRRTVYMISAEVNKNKQKMQGFPFIAETACPLKHSCNEIWTVACFVVRPQCSLDFRPFAIGLARQRDEQPGGFPYLTTHTIVASVQVVRKEL